MNIALIGNGAIAQYVHDNLAKHGTTISAFLLRPERVAQIGQQKMGQPIALSDISALPKGVNHIIDCAGHSGLRTYGPAALRAGYDVTTISVGALADQDFYTELQTAAKDGSAKLHLASGAIGALDCLQSARVGKLHRVRYVGRKPPLGWVGSPAEDHLDLASLKETAKTHFLGSARKAAINYPKNANVAAAVALAGIGFDDTEVELIADPNVSSNIHEVIAEGDFGSFQFQISGHPLADNPRSSALAAMSVVSAIERQTGSIIF
jgi:aspartate dehydrogenase